MNAMVQTPLAKRPVFTEEMGGQEYKLKTTEMHTELAQNYIQ
jgi:hypothetical protein